MLSPYAPLAKRFLSNLPTIPSACALNELDEAKLIAASQQGNAAAYGSLVCKYQDRLCSSLWHVCGSLADAQDAAQEAFLRAYLNLANYNASSSFYSWLYRIALNVAITVHRRRQARLAWERARSLEEHAFREHSVNPDERVLRAERIAEVRRALNRLSTEHRTILILREFDNLDYDQISSSLAIPVGTVRSRLHRARLELREMLSRVSLED